MTYVPCTDESSGGKGLELVCGGEYVEYVIANQAGLCKYICVYTRMLY